MQNLKYTSKSHVSKMLLKYVNYYNVLKTFKSITETFNVTAEFHYCI